MNLKISQSKQSKKRKDLSSSSSCIHTSTHLSLLYFKKQVFDSVIHMLDLQQEISLWQIFHL